MGKNTVQTKQWLDKCYLDSAPLETTVKRWYADFKRSPTDTNDAEHSGHLNSAVVPENTKKFHNLVLADCKLKLREIVEELNISRQCIHYFAWTFVNEKAVLKVDAAFTHS